MQNRHRTNDELFTWFNDGYMEVNSCDGWKKLWCFFSGIVHKDKHNNN